jgi:phosphoribosylformimino-5-aminoimidazole carboxamide ribotide isomerase
MLTCYNATMQVIPALDLLGDDAVRLEQGDYDRIVFRRPVDEVLERIVDTSPPLIHVVDLQGARDGSLRIEVVSRCAQRARGVPLQVSGGIRSPDVGHAALAAGAARIIVGTAAWASPADLDRYVDEFGEALVVALDIRDGRLAVRAWQSSSPIGLDEALERCVASGVPRVHVTAIERDGTMRGPDLALYERACQSGLAVLAAGGVRGEDDLAALERVGCEAAVMGLGYLGRLGLAPDG